MTISSTIRKAGPYTCNGVTVAFPFTYKVFTAADVLVVQTDSATSIETVKTLSTDYSVSLNADQNTNPGGSVVMLAAPASGQTLTLASQVANLQPMDLTNGGGFYPEVLTNSADRTTILIQQIQEQVNRSFKTPISGSNPVSDVQDYVTQAKASADAAAASAATFIVYTEQSTSAAAEAAASAVLAAAAASAATAPTASILAEYLDAYFLQSQTISFASMYVSGGWDLGPVGDSSPFSNETQARRASLSAGAGVFDFGTIP